jgi:hypothetical protein
MLGIGGGTTDSGTIGYGGTRCGTQWGYHSSDAWCCDGAYPKSKWVLETLTEFGIVLGASFEGYEEELTKILQDIEEEENKSWHG